MAFKLYSDEKVVNELLLYIKDCTIKQAVKENESIQSSWQRFTDEQREPE